MLTYLYRIQIDIDIEDDKTLDRLGKMGFDDCLIYKMDGKVFIEIARQYDSYEYYQNDRARAIAKLFDEGIKMILPKTS